MYFETDNFQCNFTMQYVDLQYETHTEIILWDRNETHTEIIQWDRNETKTEIILRD